MEEEEEVEEETERGIEQDKMAEEQSMIKRWRMKEKGQRKRRRRSI